MLVLVEALPDLLLDRNLGPAREGPSEDQIKEALAKRAQQLGAAPPTAYGATEKKEDNDDDDGTVSRSGKRGRAIRKWRLR